MTINQKTNPQITQDRLIQHYLRARSDNVLQPPNDERLNDISVSCSIETEQKFHITDWAKSHFLLQYFPQTQADIEFAIEVCVIKRIITAI